MNQENFNANLRNQTQSPKNFIFFPVIIVLITGLVVGGGMYLWQSSVAKKEMQKLKTQLEQLQTISTKETTPEKTDNQLNEQEDIIQEFIGSSYRVVSVGQNPFSPYSLIIATERSETQCGTEDEPSRCANDTTCGSIYTSRNCYFFLEPHFVYGVDSSTRFIGQWKGGLDALLLETIKFKDKKNIEFESAGGDGQVSVRVSWNLNLEIGEVTEINRQTFGPDTD